LPPALLPVADARGFQTAEELGDGRVIFAHEVRETAHADVANILALRRSLAEGFNVPGVEHCLMANELDAYLMALTHLRRQPSAVVRTAFGNAEHHFALQNPQARAGEAPHRAANFVYGDIGNADVVLIPRLNYYAPPGLVRTSDTTGHFTIGAYNRLTGVVHHYDPLQLEIDEEAKRYYRRVIATLHQDGEREFRFRSVWQRPPATFNRQNDGVNCGFYAALIGELVLLHGHDRTFIPRFGRAELRRERIRIANFIEGIIEGVVPDYQPPPATQRRAPANASVVEPRAVHTDPSPTEQEAEPPTSRQFLFDDNGRLQVVSNTLNTPLRSMTSQCYRSHPGRGCWAQSAHHQITHWEPSGFSGKQCPHCNAWLTDFEWSRGTRDGAMRCKGCRDGRLATPEMLALYDKYMQGVLPSVRDQLIVPGSALFKHFQLHSQGYNLFNKWPITGVGQTL